jgi:hypothetical protein
LDNKLLAIFDYYKNKFKLFIYFKSKINIFFKDNITSNVENTNSNVEAANSQLTQANKYAVKLTLFVDNFLANYYKFKLFFSHLLVKIYEKSFNIDSCHFSCVDCSWFNYIFFSEKINSWKNDFSKS